MMGTAILALMGMGLLVAGFAGSGGSDDTDTPETDDIDDIDVQPTPPLPEDVLDADTRTLSLLEDSAPINATPDGEVFAATEPRPADGFLPKIIGFDPDTDLVAFNITDLAEAHVTPEGDPIFAHPERLSYNLNITPHLKLGGTVVTLSLFDASDFGTPPVHYDVHLPDIDVLDADNVSVVAGATDFETAEGGERAGFQDADTVVVSQNDSAVSTGTGNDSVSGLAEGALINTRAGDDSVALDATDTRVTLGAGNDTAQITGGPGNSVDGGDGNDSITVALGTDVVGGHGTDTLAVQVNAAPEDGLPLFLWNQPVEDARFSAHSTITLDDDLDTLSVSLMPDVPGHLHQVVLTQESYGTSSSEVYTHKFTLVIWTPEGVTDIADLVNGGGSEFNGSLAQDSAPGAPSYEAAATDPAAPRVILTVDHGTDFSGWVDDATGEASGAITGIHDLNLIVNRELTSLHDSEIY